MRKFTEISAIKIFLIASLLIADFVYGGDLGQKDLEYQLKVFPLVFEARKQYIGVSNLIWGFIENPNVDQANEVCKQASKSYKALRNLEKKMTRVKPGKMYSNFNRILHQLIGIRNASLILFIQACGLDPAFEKPDVWNSFEQRWSLLDKQSNEASTRLEEELNNIDNSLREH